MTLPYQNATSGLKARDEITKTLQRFGCERVGFMDDYAEHSLLLHFVHRGRTVELRASAKGWGAAMLKEKPYSHRMQRTRQAYEQWALEQGMVAVNSILRDWVKGQVTAVETGILSFEAVFLPHMLTHDGTKLLDVIEAGKLLPAPAEASA